MLGSSRSERGVGDNDDLLRLDDGGDDTVRRDYCKVRSAIGIDEGSLGFVSSDLKCKMA